jgi:hypothetical protein
MAVSSLALADSAALPNDLEPVAAPLTMRCGPTDEYTARLEFILHLPGQPPATVYRMEATGSVVADGDSLRGAGTYYDVDATTGVQRGPFWLETVATELGEPLSIVISPIAGQEARAPAPGSPEYAALIEELDKRMREGMMPVEPVAMGGEVSALDTGADSLVAMMAGENVRFVSNDVTAVLAGTVERNGATLAVVEHKGSVVFESRGERVRARIKGYSTLNPANCAAGDGVIRLTFTLTKNEDVPMMVFEAVVEVLD